MKKVFALPLIGLSMFVQVVSADQDYDVHAQEKPSVQQQDSGQSHVRHFMAIGTVRKIDSDNSIVIIFHNPVAALMWPSMTMPFAVSDRALFGQFRVGEKVEFEFVRGAKNGVIIGIK